MLKLDPAPTFTAPALISVPGGDPIEVRITWRHKGRAAYQAWLDGPPNRTDVQALAEIIADWGVEIDAPYNEENLARLLDIYPAAATDLILAYRQALFEGRRKN